MLILPSVAIVVSLLVSAYALYKGWKQHVVRFLVLTLVFLALEQAVLGWRMLTVLPSEAFLAQQVMHVLQVLSLNFGLAFSFGYGQIYGWEKIKARKWMLLFTTLSGLLIVLYPAGKLIEGLPFKGEEGWVFLLGVRGQVFYVFVLLVSTLVLINLEKLLRSSYGRIRWQLKFSTVGLGAFFALRIYQSGKALVFSTWQQELDGITAVGLILACGCLVIALRRTTEGIDIYLSTEVLKNSVAALVVGSYLLGVGILVAVFRYFNLNNLVEQSFLIVAVLFLVFLFISDRSRQALRLLASRHFRRPSYDYRSLWRNFNSSTSTVFDEDTIARDVVRMISENLQLMFVAIWTYDPRTRRFNLSASSSGLDEKWKGIHSDDLEKMLAASDGLIEFEAAGAALPGMEGFCGSTGCQGIIPLRGKESLLGFLAFGQKVGHRGMTLEERELLDMLGQQTAGALLNVSLFQKVAEVSEVEAFRNMSAFFLHDMKNLANQLSLTVENLPKFYDNEEFRVDALQVLSESVARIKRISSGMVLLRDEIRVQPEPVDLREFVQGVLAGMRPETGGMIREDFRDVPRVRIDREQMRKVLVNLLLNAGEAVEEAGRGRLGTGFESAAAGGEGADRGPDDFPISVSIYQADGSVVIEVADRGTGMSADFVRERLFQAFQTTKHQGMGVGLFQSRMIVEAHNGRIEVESEPGKGSSFRVVLPAGF